MEAFHRYAMTLLFLMGLSLPLIFTAFSPTLTTTTVQLAHPTTQLASQWPEDADLPTRIGVFALWNLLTEGSYTPVTYRWSDDRQDVLEAPVQQSGDDGKFVQYLLHLEDAGYVTESDLLENLREGAMNVSLRVRELGHREVSTYVLYGDLSQYRQAVERMHVLINEIVFALQTPLLDDTGAVQTLPSGEVVVDICRVMRLLGEYSAYLSYISFFPCTVGWASTDEGLTEGISTEAREAYWSHIDLLSLDLEAISWTHTPYDLRGWASLGARQDALHPFMGDTGSSAGALFIVYIDVAQTTASIWQTEVEDGEGSTESLATEEWVVLYSCGITASRLNLILPTLDKVLMDSLTIAKGSTNTAAIPSSILWLVMIVGLALLVSRLVEYVSGLALPSTSRRS